MGSLSRVSGGDPLLGTIGFKGSSSFDGSTDEIVIFHASRIA